MPRFNHIKTWTAFVAACAAAASAVMPTRREDPPPPPETFCDCIIEAMQKSAWVTDVLPPEGECAAVVSMPPTGGLSTFTSRCWSIPGCVATLTPPESCDAVALAEALSAGRALNLDLRIGPAAGDYPPVSHSLPESTSPLLTAGVNHHPGPAMLADRQTVAGQVDLITGRPLIKAVDLELPFGTAVYRQIRTYGEPTSDLSHEWTDDCWAPDRGKIEQDHYWDWNGQGWMIGSNPILLIDAKYFGVVEQGDRVCYFLPDAHRSIPFVFTPDVNGGQYIAPPRFDAIMLQEGGDWNETTNEWDTRPTKFTIWLHGRSVKYTIYPVYEDIPDHPAGGTYHDASPSNGTGGQLGLGDPRGVPYYGLTTEIADRAGNIVKINYCNFERQDRDNLNNVDPIEDPTDCVECCQYCVQKGQIRSVQLFAATNTTDPVWTLLYVHRDFGFYEGSTFIDPFATMQVSPIQRAIHAIYAYRGDPGDLSDLCLTVSANKFDELYGEVDAGSSPTAEELARATLHDMANLDDDEFLATIPTGWEHRARYVYRDWSPNLDAVQPVGYPLYTPYLLYSKVTSRQAKSGGGWDETSAYSVYRYATEGWQSAKNAISHNYPIALEAVWDPTTLASLFSSINALDGSHSGRAWLECWPFGLVTSAYTGEISTVRTTLESPPQSEVIQTPLRETARVVMQRWYDDDENDIVTPDAADLVAGKWATNGATQGTDVFARSDFHSELRLQYMAELPSPTSGDKPVALGTGVAMIQHREGASAPKYYRLYRFMIQPGDALPSDAPSCTDGNPTSPLQFQPGITYCEGAPMRSYKLHPYYKSDFNNLATGEHGDPASLSDIVWAVAVDEYDNRDAWINLAIPDSGGDAWPMFYDVFEAGYLEQLPVSRRIVYMNAAGVVIAERTYRPREGNSPATTYGLAQSYIYDWHLSGMAPLGRLMEHRTFGWSAAEQASSGTTQGLVRVYEYEEGDANSGSTGLYVAAEGVRQGSVYNAIGSNGTWDTDDTQWTKQFFRHPDRPDLVEYEITFTEPTSTLLDSGDLNTIWANSDVVAIQSDYEFEGTETEKILRKVTTRGLAPEEPGGTAFFSVIEERESIDDDLTITEQLRGNVTTTPISASRSAGERVYTDVQTTDNEGRAVVQVWDFEDGTLAAPSGITSDFASLPAETARGDAPTAANHWKHFEYGNYGIDTERRHTGLLDAYRYTEFLEDDEIYLEQWIFRDVPFDTAGALTDVSDAKSPGEMNRYHLGQVQHRIFAMWPDEMNAAAISLSSPPPAVMTLLPQYDEGGRPTGISLSGTGSGDSASVEVAYGRYGEVNRERHPDGTITRHVFDELGRQVRTYRGTNDEHEYWGTAPPSSGPFDDNLLLIEKRYYGTSPKDAMQVRSIRRLREKPTDQYGSSTSSSNEDEIGIVERHHFDWRMRSVVTAHGPADPMSSDPDGVTPLRHSATWLDNADRVRFSAVYGDTFPFASAVDPSAADPDDALPTAAAILSAATAPRRLTETIYDLRGLPTITREYDVSDTSGDSYLETITLYDFQDRVVFTRSPNGLDQRMRYDGMGREIESSQWAGSVELTRMETCYDAFGHVQASVTRERLHTSRPDPTSSTLDALDEADSVTSVVFQWHDLKGRLVAEMNVGAWHGDGWDDGHEHWTSSTTSGQVSLTTILAGRQSSAPDWELSSGAPGVSAPFQDALVTTYVYDSEGRQARMWSPRGICTEYVYDSFGRVLLTTENATEVNGDPKRQTLRRYQDGRLTHMATTVSLEGSGSIDIDVDPDTGLRRVDAEAYDDVWTDTSGLYQVTAFVYGADVVSEGAISTAVSANNGWIGAIHFPDRATGAPAPDPDLVFTYYPDGLLAKRLDARGIEAAHEYDALGNRIHTSFVEGNSTAYLYEDVEDRVVDIEHVFDHATGELLGVIARNQNDAIVASNKFEYNARGNLEIEYQQHGALVSTGMVPSPSIEYEWEYREAMASSDRANIDRLVMMTYPENPQSSNRREVGFLYGEDEADVDDWASRITRIVDTSLFAVGSVIEYQYAGVGRRATAVAGLRAGPDTIRHTSDDRVSYRLSQVGTVPTGQVGYMGWDRFGRIADLTWKDGLSTPNTLAARQYGYDKKSNRLWEHVTQVQPSGNSNSFVNSRSAAYQYDALNRIIESAAGEVDTTDPMAPEIDDSDLWPTTRSQEWSLDLLGNWDGIDSDTGTSSPQTTSVSHSVNLRNELQSLATTGGPTHETVYDASGNLIFDGTYFYQYDAFGRLMKVSQKGSLYVDSNGELESTPGDWILHYTYDGLGRLIRVQRPVPHILVNGQPGVRTERYFYDGVRRIQEVFSDPVAYTEPDPEEEEEIEMEAESGGSVTVGDMWVEREYIHSPDYVDEVVCQIDEANDPYFHATDANYNVIALISEPQGSGTPTGKVLSQYTYDPYGEIASVETLQTHATNRIGHQGLFFDRLDAGITSGGAPEHMVPGVFGAYQNRSRTYIPRYGRFAQQDPNQSGTITLARGKSGAGGWPSLGGLSVNPDGLFGDGANLHGYCAGMPLNATDAYGLMAYLQMGADGGIRGSIFGMIGVQIARAIPYAKQNLRYIVGAGAVIGGALALPELLDWIGLGSKQFSSHNALPRPVRGLDKLSKREAERLAESGEHPHELKPGGSRQDLYKDKEGNVYVGNKDGTGEADPTGINMNDIP